MELEYTKITYSQSLKNRNETNKNTKVVKELRRKYALKDLLEIVGFPKSVYYYYDVNKLISIIV